MYSISGLRRNYELRLRITAFFQLRITITKKFFKLRITNYDYENIGKITNYENKFAIKF
uniref:Uncharacterized protein n=1 Tax=Meloidogyne enterolobii TaxID=390850 RepID=A0A6V7UF98_MELEN|nr:unnamed protein product [Meloidogyne enterolobii]